MNVDEWWVETDGPMPSAHSKAGVVVKFSRVDKAVEFIEEQVSRGTGVWADRP